jgi:outer membrane protein OmpA-like peptidoglycan-associated protein
MTTSYLRRSLPPLALYLAALSAGACGGPPRPVYAVEDRGEDADGDGAPDIDDSCPNDPEDGLPPKANDGCPASDPDNDGVLLADDKCPNAKEDGQPPSPDDGCPAADTDKDGVADAKDKCPDKLEDNIEPSPSDGCPAGDADGDGIADARDKCPQQAETVNGCADQDGCPDEAPAGGGVVLVSEAGEICVPQSRKIEFEFESADLTPAAQGTIHDVAKVLREHPEVQRVEIEGHASSKGDSNYNVSLTDKRALAVARALEKQGVEGKRLVAIGYGEYCPAIDKGDDVDEPKNRRVLLKTVLVNGVWQKVERGCWRAQTAGIDPTKKKPVTGAGGGGGTSAPPVKPVGGA